MFTLEAAIRYDVFYFFWSGKWYFYQGKAGKNQGILKSNVCCNHGGEILDFDSSCFNFPGFGSESESQSDNEEESERDESRDGARTEGEKATREGTEDW